MSETASDNRPGDRGAEARVRDTLERFRTGWERQDAGQVLSTIWRRDDTVIYGTDLAECWVGFDALVEPFEAMAEAIDTPVYTWGPAEPSVWVKGDVAWACGTLTVRLTDNAGVHVVAMRSTFILENGETGWKITHAHFSIGQDEAVIAYGDKGLRS